MIEYNGTNKKEVLIDELTDMKKGSYEEMWLITVYGLSSYFKSLFAFGYKSKVTKDNLNVIKEMFKILYTERKIFNYILKNLDQFHLSSTEDVINMLDELNGKTVEYYYHVIEDIEDACELKEELRGKRPRKEFPTLIQSSSYANEVVALALNKKAVIEFLGYEEDFLKFIKDRDNCDLKVEAETASNLVAVVPIMHEDNVADVKFILPEVVDLETALLAIKTYQKIYSIYKCIGGPLVKDEISQDKAIQFENDYLPKLSQLMLHKKKAIIRLLFYLYYSSDASTVSSAAGTSSSGVSAPNAKSNSISSSSNNCSSKNSLGSSLMNSFSSCISISEY